MPKPVQQAVCASCGEPIYWLAHYRTRKPAPIEVRPDPTGNVLVRLDDRTYLVALPAERDAYAKYLHINHFARCPQARAWKKAGKH